MQFSNNTFASKKPEEIQFFWNWGKHLLKQWQFLTPVGSSWWGDWAQMSKWLQGIFLEVMDHEGSLRNVLHIADSSDKCLLSISVYIGH